MFPRRQAVSTYAKGPIMTLILGNEDVDDLLTMDAVIKALEPAYRNIAEGRAVAGGRADLVSETPYDPDAPYWLKMASGIVPDLEVGTVRINSDIVTWPKDGNKLRRVKAPLAPGKRWVGLVLLFSSATGEPLAIFPDGAIQRLRVAGSTGLSIKHRARQDCHVLGPLGTGWQAGAHLEAACAVRPITRVNVFSPTQGHAEKFAEENSARRGIEVVAAKTPEDAVKGADIVVTATGNYKVVSGPQMERMRNQTIVCNIGHFDNEIDVEYLKKYEWENIKPQVDHIIFPDGKRIILLAEGRLVNLGCATGHPSFVMSNSFTNQVLAQIELWQSGDKYANEVYVLPKHLDEKVARLHLDRIGAKVTVLSDEQADYIGVAKDGPYKPEHYRY